VVLATLAAAGARLADVLAATAATAAVERNAVVFARAAATSDETRHHRDDCRDHQGVAGDSPSIHLSIVNAWMADANESR